MRLICVTALLLALTALAGCKWVVKPDPKTEWAPDVRLAQVPTPPVAGRTSVAASPDGSRVIYLRATPEAMDRETQHVYMDAAGRTWVVMGLPYEGQPLSNLRWADRKTFTFERWFSEKQGLRFHLDVVMGKMVWAEPLKNK